MSGTVPGRPGRPIRTRDEYWDDLKADALQRAGDADGPHQRRLWLERARRIAPDDAMVALELAGLCLVQQDAAAAAGLFRELADRHGFAEAWTGLAASLLRLDQPTDAARAMQTALSSFATSTIMHPLAAAIAVAARQPGWCAIAPDGALHVSRPAALRLDGKALRPVWSADRCVLPAGLTLDVTLDGLALLGSPIDLRAINRLEGFVEADRGGIAGWAWHPHDPARPPTLRASQDGWHITVALQETAGGSREHRPMTRLRRFHMPVSELPTGPIHVTDWQGRDVLGSPLDPGLELRCAAGAATGFNPIWADLIGPAPVTIPRRRGIDIVIPVYGGGERTLACLRSVLATIPRGVRVRVVDDAGPDAALIAAIAQMPGVKLIRLPRNRGFPAAANAGLRAAGGRDVVLLNSDTLLPPGWLPALADAAYSAAGIGTACPWSNQATILSYPAAGGGNPMLDVIAMARLAQRASGDAVVEIPVAVGFCMFIRHDCLAATGLLREDVFAQGYGEEVDWCLRARHRGWRHVAALGTFVGHYGGSSFGGARQMLEERNAAVLERLHPGFGTLVQAWQARDPLGPARRAMDAARLRAPGRSALLVTHEGGGGVDRVIAARTKLLAGQGIRAVLLRPNSTGVTVGDAATPNLRWALPGEWPALLRFLRTVRPDRVELHHMLGQSPLLLTLAAALRVPQDVFIHDYAWFCPRIALVPHRSYCGEPPLAGCEACIADHGSLLEEPIGVAALVERSAGMFAASRQVVAPSRDAAHRIRRHFPDVKADVIPWEDDAAIPRPPPFTPAGRGLHVCVIGGIGPEKGLDVLVQCVRDATARRLPLRFTVIGHTGDDERLLGAGDVYITGRYKEADALALIRAQSADMAFLPSIWPETWCFTLGAAWRAGLRAAVFDLGAPAERVRQTGWGWLLPLGLSAVAVNDWFIRQGAAAHAPSHNPAVPAI